jgi:hypothetical protein
LICGLAIIGGLLAVVNACSSFETEKSGTPSDAAIDQDMTLPDGAPSCATPILPPTDAGEDARCGPDGATIDLRTSPAHCGSCNHDCAGESCEEGHCRIVDVTNGYSYVVLGAVGAGSIHYTTYDDNCSQGELRRKPVDGGPYTSVYKTGGGCLTRPSFVEPSTFVVHSNVGIVSIADDGGLSIVLDNSQGGPFDALVATNERLFFLRQGRIVESSTHDGKQRISVHDDPTTTRVVAMISDGSRAIWAASAADGTTKIWARGSKSTDSSVLLAETTQAPYLATDATHLYIATEKGGVVRVPKSGGPIEPVTRIFGDELHPRGLAVGETDVVVMTSTARVGSDQTVGIWTAAKCGGSARLVAHDVVYTDGLLLVDRDIFWTPGSRVRKIVK